MTITGREAWVILGAIEVAGMERGLYEGEKCLIQRIRSAFPEIARVLDEEELEEKLWEKALDDPEVQALYREACEQDALESELGMKFFAAKQRAFERLLAAHGPSRLCRNCGYEGIGWRFIGNQDRSVIRLSTIGLYNCPRCGSTRAFEPKEPEHVEAG